MREAGVLEHALDTTRALSMSDEGGASGARMESQEPGRPDDGARGLGAGTALALVAGFGIGLLLVRLLTRASR